MPAQSNLINYPSPVEEEPCLDYKLTVNGQPVFTHRARVSAQPVNQVWPGYQRPLEQMEIASFAAWGMTNPVEVSITCSGPIEDVRIRPSSYGIQPVVEDNTIRFMVNKPGQLAVEVNGTHKALHLFADPPEDNSLDINDPNVRYFGPGVHCVGLLQMESNQTIYIAGGAVVYGAIIAEHAQNIRITGRGILDGSKFDRMDLNGLISLYQCTDVRIDGIILRDPSGWTLVPVACQQVHISNIKIIGLWRYNSDGIDFVNCQHCSVEDSFIRSFDDSIVLKGYDNWGPYIYPLQLNNNGWTIDGVNYGNFAQMQDQHGKYPCNAASITDFEVRRCVIWNDWGRALEIGAETVADEITHILFEDCDVIHTTHVAMDIQNSDRATCKDIIFRNIRVELDDDFARPDPHPIVLQNINGYCSYDCSRGHIEDIHFQNIEITSPNLPVSVLEGYDPEHLVQRVTIEDMRINGEPVTTLKTAGFNANEFVKEISFM